MITVVGAITGVILAILAFRTAFRIGRDSFGNRERVSVRFPYWRRTPVGQGMIAGLFAAILVFLVVQLLAAWLERFW